MCKSMRRAPVPSFLHLIEYTDAYMDAVSCTHVLDVDAKNQDNSVQIKKIHMYASTPKANLPYARLADGGG